MRRVNDVDLVCSNLHGPFETREAKSIYFGIYLKGLEQSMSVTACSHEDYTQECEIIFKRNKKRNVNDSLDDIPFDLINETDRETYFEQLVKCAEKRICNAERERNNHIDASHRNIINRILGRVGAYVQLLKLQLPPLRNSEQIDEKIKRLQKRAKNLQSESIENTPTKAKASQSYTPLGSPVPSLLEDPFRSPMREVRRSFRNVR